MVFLKPIKDLELTDIEKLKTNRTCESPILDYKKRLLEDNKLLKQVSAFANTQGGFLVFGVKETGKGGHPKEIRGIDKSKINKERMEQIILGNIQPRLNVKIVSIPYQDPTKAIVVMQIPDSYLKPHMNNRDNKFYKRYNFEAQPMTEIEVRDTYKRRFAGYQEIENYVSNLLNFKWLPIRPQILGYIIVIPTILTRMINISNLKEFEWINKTILKPKYLYIPSKPIPSSNGIRFQLKDEKGIIQQELEIHRNGCTHFKSYFGEFFDKKMRFLDQIFCIKLLHTLQFASTLYKRYNYFGDVKIVCNLRLLSTGTCKDSWLLRPHRFSRYIEYRYEGGEISISREFSTSDLETRYEYIASGIMDEIFNCYGLWQCPYFDEEGKFKEPK